MKQILLIFVFVLCALPGRAQCPDVVAHVKDILSEDQQAVARAREQEPCRLELYSKDKAFWDRVVLPYLKSENPGTRAAATAIALHMTAMRANGAAVITNFLPVFAEHLADPATLGRQNTAMALHSVMGLIDEPPEEVLQKIADAATEPIRGVQIYALSALAQTNPMPEWVSDILLTTKLDEQERLRALSHVRDMRPEIMAKLIYSLRSEDKALVEVALSAIAELGPKAAAASSELRRLAQESSDATISKSALGLAERLESPRKQQPRLQ
jgi:hypothetical protein